MVYDDDTGRRIHFDLESGERPLRGRRQKRLPSEETQRYIVQLARRPGWGAERVHAFLRLEHNRHDISLATIREILEGILQSETRLPDN